MAAAERKEDLEITRTGPHSGTVIRTRLWTYPVVDAYDTDDEVTLRAIPMPIMIGKRRLKLLCGAFAVAGAAVASVVEWVILSC